MKGSRKIFKSTLWAVCGWLLGSCGGGGGISGIEGTGAPVNAEGSVTGFGSVWVNGNRFITDDARVIINGELQSEDLLAPGMLVQVDGTVDAAGKHFANRVVHNRQLLGPIDAVASKSGISSELTMLGQTVVVTDDIAFANVKFADLAPGLIVEVSGFVTQGGMVASRVAKLEAQPETLSIEGYVDEFNAATAQLSINGAQVDFNNALFKNGNREDLASGSLINVQGNWQESSGAKLLAAQTIRFITQTPTVSTPAAIAVEIEGVISELSSFERFTIRGQSINAQNAVIKNGTAADIKVGARLIIRGNWQASDGISAAEVEVLQVGENRYLGKVSSLGEKPGQFKLLDTSFEVADTTAYFDASTMMLRSFRVGDIAVDDSLEVFARVIEGKLVATRILRLDDIGTSVSFRGEVGEIGDDAQFYVMGIQIDASEFLGTDILAGLSPGQFVSIEGIEIDEFGVKASAIVIVAEELLECDASGVDECQGLSEVWFE